MKKNRLKLGLGVLTVLATPIAVNAVASNVAGVWHLWNKKSLTSVDISLFFCQIFAFNYCVLSRTMI